MAQLWADLSNDDDDASRATKLKTFYFMGLGGFEPVIDCSHYTFGIGQIRTNQLAVQVFLAHRSEVLADFLCSGASPAAASGPEADSPLGGGSGVE